MMMMTVTENPANATSPSIDYTNYAMNRSQPAMTYDYRHGNPWEKAHYATIHHHHPSSPFSTGTASVTEKSYPSSFDALANLNNTNPNFYRRHTEFPFPTSNSIYSSLPTDPFHYSHPPPPPGLFLGWNSGSSSLIRTQSASSYPEYSPTTYCPSFPPMINSKSSTHSRHPPMATSNPYPPFLNILPTMDFSIPPPNPLKRPSPSKTSRRPRLTAHIQSEILKLKANKPTVFVWEIQQSLLENGTCTSQTLPTAKSIQRALNKSSKTSIPIKQEPNSNVSVSIRSPVTICLSPSPSPMCANGEPISECSICLESYRSGQEVSILACSHEYHSSCIGEWMVKNRSCPMCRKDIHDQPQFVTLLI